MQRVFCNPYADVQMGKAAFDQLYVYGAGYDDHIGFAVFKGARRHVISSRSRSLLWIGFCLLQKHSGSGRMIVHRVSSREISVVCPSSYLWVNISCVNGRFNMHSWGLAGGARKQRYSSKEIIADAQYTGVRTVSSKNLAFIQNLHANPYPQSLLVYPEFLTCPENQPLLPNALPASISSCLLHSTRRL